MKRIEYLGVSVREGSVGSISSNPGMTQVDLDPQNCILVSNNSYAHANGTFCLFEGYNLCDAEDIRHVDPTKFKEIDRGGMWNKILFANHRFVLHSDRFASLPFFWCALGDRVVFSNNLKLLLSEIPVTPDISVRSVMDMLNFWFLRKRATLLEGVCQTMAGDELEIQEGMVSVHSRPFLFSTNSNEKDRGLESYIKEFDGILGRTMTGFADRFGKRAGIALSGGLDSRLLAAGCHRAGMNLSLAHCFLDTKELRLARCVAETLQSSLAVAQRLGDQFEESYTRDSQDSDGHLNAHQFLLSTTYELLANAGPPDFCLDGFFLDVTLGGTYFVPSISPNDRIADRFAAGRATYHPYTMKLFLGNRMELLQNEKRSVLDEIESMAQGFDLEPQKKLLMVLVTYFARQYLLRQSVMNQKKVNLLVPNLETSWVEFWQKLPSSYRENHRFYRAFYARRFPELAAIPWAKSGKPLQFEKTRVDGIRKEIDFYLRALVARVSFGRIDFHAPHDGNLLYRRDPKFRAFVKTTLYENQGAFYPLIARSDLDRLFRLTSWGWQTFNIIEPLLGIALLKKGFL